MIDLVLWRRVSRDGAGRLIVSTATTGVASADKMLAHIARHPGTMTGDILATAPGRMADFVDGADTRRRRFTAPRIAFHLAEAERRHLDRTVTGDIDSPRSAALAMLADALRLVSLAEPATVLGACGEAAWMVEECIDYLLLVRYKYELVVAAGSAGG
jgi:hypothetical protein